MTTIVRHLLEPEGALATPDAAWTIVASDTRSWLATVDIDIRDAVVLLPFAPLLPLARRAFGVSGGFLPRIETTQTLAAALGPPAAPELGQISFDSTVDALIADQLLRSRPWGDAWARRDGRGFEHALELVVATAHALLRAAAALPPQAREAHWAGARQLLSPVSGPGGTERLLALVALEWASLAPAPASDRLFALRPGAWVVVQAGGAEPLAAGLLAAASDCPALLIDADTSVALVAGRCSQVSAPPTLAICESFENEAQAAAAQVVEHLRRGEAPVALIAQDRVLVRRIRALLERDALVMRDETGWKLSTTRAAALVMSLLRAARPDASSDSLLDWLKAVPNRDSSFAASLDAFEARLRRGQLRRVDAIERAFADDPIAADETRSAASGLWSAASSLLRNLAGIGRRRLPDWISALRQALIDCGTWPTMEQDDAGRQVIAALRMSAETSTAAAWRLASAGVTLSLAGFTGWVDRVMEQASFAPATDAGLAPDVVITPLARAMLRPFAAVVFPGADDKHLGAPGHGDELLGDAQARALGITDRAGRGNAELLAFGQLLRTPAVTFLRRRVDGAEPLAQSPLLARLALVLSSAGSGLMPWRDPRSDRIVATTPIRGSAPSAADLLPQRLSASACEALRACPYRFFALNLLRLGEEDELDGEVEKRDYGNWLHAVLNSFHLSRTEPASADEETARLFEVAEATRRQAGIAAEDFLLFAASFASLAPRYVAWLHARDRAGWRWSGGEIERVIEPEGFDGIALRGIIDRVDSRTGFGPAGDASATELIDYKTGSAAGFREKVQAPLEDTQLAFYAALMPERAPMKAIYLALDGSKGIEAIEHPEVAQSADALLRGLADELGRIRAGAGLPALGVGTACDWCAARGICRRDHWSAAEPAA